MRILLLSIAVLLIAPQFARAEDENVIKIIQPDGSVVVVKMPTAPAPPEPEPVPEPQEVKDAIAAEEAAPSAPEPEAVPVPAEKPQARPVPAPQPSKPKPIPTQAESDGRIINPEPAPLPVLPPTPGRIITKEIATQIALENAPPALSVMTVRRTYEGRLVWVVTFRTESGSRDVLVDAQTGEIVGP